MPFQSTKRYGHELGLSACFRQWRAQSHCRFLHGYALAVKLVFEADDLDSNLWVVDFGSLKPLKSILENTFDHKTLVAEDDPELRTFQDLEARGLIQLVVTPSNGCEMFAYMVYEVTEQWLKDAGYGDRVRIISAEVSEHGANSALYVRG